MGIAFAGALLLIYILIVWEFGNFRVPLIIISPIPLTMIGIMIGHWVMGAEFTATSMIGFIALAGIVVRNSILLVDFAQNAIRGGMAPREALALAGQARMRPIIITALALMGGVGGDFIGSDFSGYGGIAVLWCLHCNAVNPDRHSNGLRLMV